jgi:arsenical pump membrane protein
LYLTAHLANSASLLLPVSNLTNLLALALLPISFGRFTALMALPWLVVIVVEVIGVRMVLPDGGGAHRSAETVPPPLPRFATAVVALTVVGFGVGEALGLAPVWVATAGAAVLALRRLLARRTSLVAVYRSASPSFCLFVLGLGIVVQGAAAHGLTRVAQDLLPNGAGLVALLGVAAVSAVAANLVNNLPATLVLLPVAAVGGIGPALAVLIGVNVGPNLTYGGSLATLLWRRAVSEFDGVPKLAEFSKLGLATAPVALVLAIIALWIGLRM